MFKPLIASPIEYKMMRNSLCRFLTGVAVMTLLLVALKTHAQGGQYPITLGTISACEGVFEDSGGPSQYGSNENLTAVICPTTPGDVVSLQWLIWALDPSGTQQNMDRLRLWDGSSTSDPFMGEYTASDPLGGVVFTASNFNPTGCITVQFVSNGSGVGDFAAILSCTTPCERPTAIASMNEMPIALICVGEEVSFDGTASEPADGFTIVDYTWDFDDGSTQSGSTSSHSFSEPGEYVVQLNVIDDNGCVNSNQVDLTVRVSTTPEFSGTLESVISCVGATVDLSANVEPTTWVDLPETNFGGALELADSPGLPFSNELVFSQFEPGQTLTDIDDLLSVCVSMEHSYMGDLAITVTCPNGSVVALHQQGGGGTFLGDANDSDSGGDIQPGTCWDYCWSPNSTQGTWADNSNFGPTPNTIPAPSTPGAQALEPGTYSSAQSMAGLVGCPLNGAWTFTITDLLFADNGAICSWSVNFDPSIIPDLSQFTPELGTSTLDSAGWSGPNLTLDPSDPLNATASVTAPGDYQYSFYVTDNHGCVYDTTMTVTVPEPPVVDAGDPIVLCSDPLPMAGSILANAPPAPFVFEWTPTTGLDDPTDPETDVFVTEPTLFYLSTYPAGHPECAVTDSVWVSPDPSIDAGVSTTIILCANDPLFLLTDSLDGTPDGGGVWTSSTGAVVGDTFDPNVGASDLYTYTVTSPAGCEATSTLDITVIPAADPACCGVVDAGPDAFSCGLTIELSAIRGNTGVGNWQGPAGAVFADPFNTVTAVTVQPGMGGTHTFYWVENDGAFCDLIDSVRITFTDAYVFTPTVTDALCYGYSDGAITMDVTGGNAAAGLDFSWSTGLQGIMENTITDLLAGTYSLLVTDDNGCTGTTEVLVGQPIRLEIDSMAMLPVTCSGDCDGTVLVFDAEAIEYSYDDGTTWTTDPTRPASCEGVWVVRIKDAIGCIGIDQIELMGPPPVVAAFDWGPNPANVDAPTITFANTSTGADHYFWNVADLFSTTDLNTVFTFDNKEPDMYEVCLTAYNYNECSDTICQTVVIDDVLFTYIPNAFTPDGDDVNDVWWPSANIPVRTNYELLVFDRWGQVVFNTTDPYMPWEGSYQNGGETLKSDVYAFRLLYGIGDTEARKEVVGYVTLMK